MQLSPLQLVEYSFEQISIKTTEGYVSQDGSNPSLVFTPEKLAISAATGLKLLEQQKTYSDFGVKLGLQVDPKDPKGAPYSIDIEVQGIFRMFFVTHDGDLAEERRQRALVNGISMLYGVAREMVSNTTSRSRHGQMLLPAMNFSELAAKTNPESKGKNNSKAKVAKLTGKPASRRKAIV